MSKKDFVKLSDVELIGKIAQYEKKERNLKRYGAYGAVIGMIGMLIGMAMEAEIAVLFAAMIIVGGVSYYLGIRLRRKAESLVLEQLDDFFEAELEKAFGSRLSTQEMQINEPFLGKICLVNHKWNRYSVRRFYEGSYNGTHFSAANVTLYENLQSVTEDSTEQTLKTAFEGVVLRCKDICAPALDIALRRPWEDQHKSDITDPAVFCQHFSACTADNQPADDLVTPQQRELIRKLESLADNYRVIALIFRDGEAILALAECAFAEGLPSEKKSLQSIDGVRRRFKESLTSMGNLIDTLRESCGEI